jgi:hypothetical protein
LLLLGRVFHLTWWCPASTGNNLLSSACGHLPSDTAVL